MPNVKPALVKAKDNLSGHGSRPQAPLAAGASVYAPRHSNLSVRSIAQSVRGMMGHKNVDRAGQELVTDHAGYTSSQHENAGPAENAVPAVNVDQPENAAKDKSKKGKNPFSKLSKIWKKRVSTEEDQQTTAEDSHPTVTSAAPTSQVPPPTLPVRSTLRPHCQHQLRPCGHFVETPNPTFCGTNCLCFSAFAADKKLLEDPFACTVCLKDEVKRRNDARMHQVREEYADFGLEAVPQLRAEVCRLQDQLEREEFEIEELRVEHGGRFCMAAPLPTSHSPSMAT
ncbi:hypothetical protein HDK90DRAFT_466695 [Phyllosticta capitalensis]|uniref:Uncharacterized protein n=1 Tax=Phyllosticta capitalensis TaxID=121624 RepID=A0ABR1YMD8_9PEZI